MSELELRCFVGATEPELLARIEQLRAEVWLGWAGGAAASGEHEEALAAAIRVDELDRAATHVVCLHGGHIVGAGSVSRHQAVHTLRDAAHFSPFADSTPWPAAAFTRLVVSPAFRGRGVAAQIDVAREALAREWNARSVWVEARGRRVDALRAAGFVTVGASTDRRYPGAWCIMHKPLRPECDAAHTEAVPFALGFPV